MTPSPGVHRVRLSLPAAAVAETYARAGWVVWFLDGEDCLTKEELLSEIGRVGALPGWFGLNWDALVDQLRERSNAAEIGLCVVIDQAEFLGASEAMLADIVRDLAAEGEPVALCSRARRRPWRRVP
jgi:hypothetical protein